MSKVVITTGVTGSNVASRIEIHDFVKIEDQFSLYIQALDKISKENQVNELSFFQIAGIHGLPYIEWGGSGGQSSVGSWGGYCTHGSVLFPTWHRPYVALFEQILQRNALEIAKTYVSDQDRWIKAAENLRAPYWDWAAEKTAVPPAEVTSQQVNIVTPDGKRTSVTNPVYAYRFHPVDQSFPDVYQQFPTTVRYPKANGESNDALFRRMIQAQNPSIKDKILYMFRYVHDWQGFSNHTQSPENTASANSLESIHDSIHDLCGGNNGHMSDPAVAGFDPIFWLHHANVDRMLSLWSALNPGTWVSPGSAESGTWTISTNSEVDDRTNLTPFWQSDSAYWVSAKTHDVNNLGYSYPEFINLDTTDPERVREEIQVVVEQLYGQDAVDNRFFSASTAAAPKAAAQPQETKHATHAPTHANPGPTESSAPSQASTQPTEDNSDYYDWTVRVRVKKYEVGGSFSVDIFLGEPPANPDDWVTNPNFVGSHHAFVNSAAHDCANCRARREEYTEGFVHLNRVIAAKAAEAGSRESGLPGTFHPDAIEEYLRHTLTWRVQRLNGEVVDLSSVPSLEVTVSATPISIPLTTGPRVPRVPVPQAGTPRFYHGITHGRHGGAQHHG